MKRLFFISALASLFFLVLIVVLLHSFKPESLRNSAQSSLSVLFRSDVELGSLSYEWNGLRLILKAEGIKVTDPTTGQVLLNAGGFEARGRLLPFLFQRKLLTEQLLLQDARISLVRDEKNHWNWPFESHPKAESRVASQGPLFSKPIAVQMRNVSVYYADRSSVPFFHWEWKQLNVDMAPALTGGYHLLINYPDDYRSVSKVRIRYVSARLLAYVYFYDRGSMKIQITNPSGAANSNFSVRLKRASLQNLFPGYQAVSGDLSLLIDGNSEGLHPEVFKRNLILKGNVRIENGVIYGHNAVRDMLAGMSALPGFSSLTRRPFQDEFKSLANFSDTAFKSIESDIQMERERLHFLNLKMTDLFFRFECDAEQNLTQGDWTAKGAVFFRGAFSDELMGRVRDMDVLRNREAELEIPFSMPNGKYAEIQLQPNLFYIANRLIQIRGEELASRGVQKINAFLEAHPS